MRMRSDASSVGFSPVVPAGTRKCVPLSIWRRPSRRTAASSISPFFVNGLKPDELLILYRDTAGYTQAKRADRMRGIPEFVEHGAKLGQLWMEGHFEFGDPLTASGGPKLPGSKESAHGSRGASGAS